MLMQSHPGLDDPLALHNALAGVVDDNQVIYTIFLPLFLLFYGGLERLKKWKIAIAWKWRRNSDVAKMFLETVTINKINKKYFL